MNWFTTDQASTLAKAETKRLKELRYAAFDAKTYQCLRAPNLALDINGFYKMYN